MNALARLASANPVPSEAIPDLGRRLPELQLDTARSAVARPRRRRVAGVCVAVVAVAIGAPALALGTSLPGAIGDFFGSDAPSQAKAMLVPLISQTLPAEVGHPDSIRLAVSARGPEGEVQLYALHFDNGDEALGIIDATNTPPHVSAMSGGPPRALAAGQVFDVRGAGGSYPGERPIYFAGVVSPRVARVELVPEHGATRDVATAGGYMLGWISPDAARAYGDGELLAYDAAGNRIGRIDACDIGTSHDVQFRAHDPGMPDGVSAACALPPPQDPG
jgi:hypothetical protein